PRVEAWPTFLARGSRAARAHGVACHVHIRIFMNKSGFRTPLERYLARMAKDLIRPSTIGRRPAGASAVLSLGQEQLWLHARLTPHLPIYNEALTVGYTGPLDRHALEYSFNEIIRRHEIWRTTFAVQDGEPAQVVHTHVDRPLPFVDLRGLPEAER